MGKVQLIKTFALPKFMNHASLINLGKAMIKKKINSIMYNLLWKGKDKIRRLALAITKMEVCACCISNLQLWPWNLILSSLLKDFGGKFILYCNFKTGDYLRDCIPKFYRDCLTTLSN